MKKRKIILTSLALALVLVIGGIAAYLTDTTTEVKNTFTVGKVDIDLTEPAWTAAKEANENYGKEIVPGEKFDKNPTITVANDSKDAYIFMEVTIPTGTVGGTANTELFTLLQSDGTTSAPDLTKWVEVASASSGNKHVYAYGTSSAMTKVSKNGTATLFDKVQFKSAITSTEAQTLAQSDQDIKVKGYAIQADGLEVSAPEAVWALLS